VVAALAAAIVWGLIGAYWEFQSWLVAIGAGLLIGRAVAYGAVTVNRAIQGIIVVLTLGAILLGEILGMAFGLNIEFGQFDIPFAYTLYTDNLDVVRGQLLFALGGGLFGAFLGAQKAGQFVRRP